MRKGDCDPEQLKLPTINTTGAHQPTASQGGMARSPSHESFATDLSLMSLSSLGSEVSRLRFTVHRTRSNDDQHRTHHPPQHRHSVDDPLRRSPNILEGGHTLWASGSSKSSHRGSRNSLLQVPNEHYGGGSGSGNRRPLSGDTLFEEETEAIRSCGALSSVLGIMKSFSTSDIDQAVFNVEDLRPSVSEVALTSWNRFHLPANGRLESTSRSCSTWVAVGDVSSTSQLPSPQARPGNVSGESPAITATDFIRSVNKKVRQMYIRRRVLSTYKALERLTQSELSLDMKETPNIDSQGQKGSVGGNQEQGARSSTAGNKGGDKVPKVHISSDLDRSLSKELGISSLSFRGANKTLSLTVKDIERDKGKPLTKYERNMMIFNWLQSLDENAFDKLA